MTKAEEQHVDMKMHLVELQKERHSKLYLE